MISHKLLNDRAITGENNLIPVVLQKQVSLVIREFPKSFIRFHNANEMYAVNEACSILNSHNLLKRSCGFIDKCISNYTIYSPDLSSNQKKCWKRNKRQSSCIKSVSIIDFPCWYLYFCDVRCTKW